MSDFDLNLINRLWVVISESYRPYVSLREGVAIDTQRRKPTYDNQLDSPTPEYLEKYICGLTFLDCQSINFYLPYLIKYTYLNYIDDSNIVIDDFFWVIQSNIFLDHATTEQKNAIVEFLKHLQKKSFKYKIEDIIDKILEHAVEREQE